MTQLTIGVRAGIRYRRRALRKVAIVMAAFSILLLALLTDVSIGPGNFSLSQVVSAIFDPGSQGTKIDVIIWNVRLPVAVMAVLVGAMLGVAGAQMQTILNNPLADPLRSASRRRRASAPHW